MSIGQKFESANEWAKSIQLPAPVSTHHRRAVDELWFWLQPLGITTALEVGCGEPPGLLTAMLREHGIVALGIDQFMGHGDHLGDAHDLPYPDDSFGLVAARHCLEHTLCPYLVLLEMMRVSRRWLLVIVPTDSLKARNWPDHLWSLTRDSWELIFRKLGLTIEGYSEGDHTEQWALDRHLFQDHEWRFLLRKGEVACNEVAAR